jgi:hypothetical protein
MKQQRKKTTQRESYETPRLVKWGSFEQLTRGQSDGPRTDAAFPAGTPRGDITFS